MCLGVNILLETYGTSTFVRSIEPRIARALLVLDASGDKLERLLLRGKGPLLGLGDPDLKLLLATPTGNDHKLVRAHR